MLLVDSFQYKFLIFDLHTNLVFRDLWERFAVLLIYLIVRLREIYFELPL